MIKLTYGQPIRAAAWTHSTAEVFSVEGYARKNNDDVAEAVSRTIERGQELAGSIYIGGALLGDRAAAAAQAERMQAAHAAAVILATGDRVEIEGRLYTVRFASRAERSTSPIYSDPIHFIPTIA